MLAVGPYMKNYMSKYTRVDTHMSIIFNLDITLVFILSQLLFVTFFHNLNFLKFPQRKKCCFPHRYAILFNLRQFLKFTTAINCFRIYGCCRLMLSTINSFLFGAHLFSSFFSLLDTHTRSCCTI